MLLSRKNQLLLEFSFWNEPVPREGPNIYELRSYQLRVSLMFSFYVQMFFSLNVPRMFIQCRWKTGLIFEMWFLSELMSESLLLSKCGVQNEDRFQQGTNICRACFHLKETSGK